MRQPREEPLDFDFAPPPPRHAARPAPKPVAAPPRAPIQTEEAEVELELEPVAASSSVTPSFFRAVMWQIFVSVLVVLAIAQYYGAERGRTVAIGVAGVFAVFFTWALTQTQLQVTPPPNLPWEHTPTRLLTPAAQTAPQLPHEPPFSSRAGQDMIASPAKLPTVIGMTTRNSSCLRPGLSP